MLNPLPNQIPTQPCPSWEVIQQNLEVGGWPAYLCAMRIVYEWCQTLSVQLSELQQASGARPLLPGSIPGTVIIPVPSSVIDTCLSGEES